MTFTLPEVLTIFGLILTLLGIFVTVTKNLWSKVHSNTRDLSEFKLKVAQEYITSHRLSEMESKMLLSEERLHSALGNLSSRIDRLLERMENR
tara:strand:+ start:27262 stop:27540 length:279 start_codon:yes stop_codon:yes gene_type:complete